MPERHAAGGEPTLQQVPPGAARYTITIGLGLDLGAARLDWV